MQIRLQFLLLTCFMMTHLVDGQLHSVLDSFLGPFRIFRLGTARILDSATSSRSYRRSLNDNEKLQPILNMEFPCSKNGTQSEKRPTSIHKLRPGDINVVGAIGDSLTVGFGLTAINLFQLFNENRGQSFSIGGQGTWRDTLTVPNILKEFNPNLIGYSLGSSLSIERASQFNVAEIGAISKETPYMANILIQRMRNDPRVNMKEDWKMVTILIGANDFCSEMCFQQNHRIFLENHKNDLLKVLRTLRDNLPRTFVNLISAPHMSILAGFTGKPSICKLTNLAECPCIVGPRENMRSYYYELMHKWQNLDAEISNYEEFDLEDFTVVWQPFTINYTFPITKDGFTDYTYTSVDCFHFSQKGNARVANSLWNNILEPVGRKNLNGVNIMEKFNCATKENPYIFTRRNSDYR